MYVTDGTKWSYLLTHPHRYDTIQSESNERDLAVVVPDIAGPDGQDSDRAHEEHWVDAGEDNVSEGGGTKRTMYAWHLKWNEKNNIK